MVERRGRPRLLLEALRARLGSSANDGGQDLDRDVAAEPRVARAIDLAHAAGAERRDDLVGAEPGAGRECHGTTLILWPDRVQCAHALFHRRNQRMARRIALRFAFTGFLILTAAAASPQPPGGQQPPPINPNAIVPGEFVDRSADADQPRLRVVHRGRRQPQRVGRRLVPQEGRHARGSSALPLLRLQGERIYSESRSSTSSSPNMFAGSILDLEPDTATRRSSSCRDPDGVTRRGAEDGHRPHAARADAVRRRARLPCLSARASTGQKIEPAFEGLMCAYNFCVRRHRLGDRGAAARAGRATPSWCTPGLYKYNRYEYTNDADRQPHGAARRHLLPDRRRHGRRCRS